MRGFISFSRDDKDSCQELVRFLAPLRRVYGIPFWTDDDIRAGDQWDSSIRDAVAQSDIFLLLCSQNWLSSTYIQDEEVPAIQKRVRARKGLVIPVILVPGPWDDELRHLQAVPTDATGTLRPIRDWNRHHDGFNAAAAQIKTKIVAQYKPAPIASGWDSPALAVEDDPRGLSWLKQDHALVAVIGGGTADADVANDPTVRQLHQALRGATADLTARMPDPGDDPVLCDIDTRVREAAVAFDTEIADIPANIANIYNAARSLDIARRHSARLRIRRANQDTQLDILIHDRPEEVATQAVIWVRQFPRALQLDQANEVALDASRLGPLGRAIIEAARNGRLISDADVALVLPPDGEPRSDEPQAGDLARAILGTRNLLYRLAAFAVGFTENAAVRGLEEDQPLADRVAGLLGAEDTQNNITALLADLPHELTDAFRRLMSTAAEGGLRLPDPPVARPPPFDAAAVRAMVLAGQSIPDAWAPLVTKLDLSGTGLIDLTSLAGLTALQSLALYRTGVSDVTPLAGLTALQSLDLFGTGVSDVTPLAGLTALRSLILRGTGVRDVTPLRHLTNLRIIF